jgi:hypothetical protein
MQGVLSNHVLGNGTLERGETVLSGQNRIPLGHSQLNPPLFLFLHVNPPYVQHMSLTSSSKEHLK